MAGLRFNYILHSLSNHFSRCLERKMNKISRGRTILFKDCVSFVHSLAVRVKLKRLVRLFRLAVNMWLVLVWHGATLAKGESCWRLTPHASNRPKSDYDTGLVNGPVDPLVPVLIARKCVPWQVLSNVLNKKIGWAMGSWSAWSWLGRKTTSGKRGLFQAQ